MGMNYTISRDLAQHMLDQCIDKNCMTRVIHADPTTWTVDKFVAQARHAGRTVYKWMVSTPEWSRKQWFCPMCHGKLNARKFIIKEDIPLEV